MASLNSVNGIAPGGQAPDITLERLTAFNNKYGTYDTKTHSGSMEMFKIASVRPGSVRQMEPRTVSLFDKICRFFKSIFSKDTTMQETSRAFYDDVSHAFNGKIPDEVKAAMGKHCKEEGVKEPVLLSQVRRVQSLASQALDKAQRQAIMNNEEFRYERNRSRHIRGMTQEQKEEFIRTEKENDAYQKQDFSVDDQVVYKEKRQTIRQDIVQNGFLNTEGSDNKKVPDNKKALDNKETISGGKKVPGQLSKVAKVSVDGRFGHNDDEMNSLTEIRPSQNFRFQTNNKEIKKQRATNGEVDDLSNEANEANDLSRTEEDENINPNNNLDISIHEYNGRPEEEYQ